MESRRGWSAVGRGVRAHHDTEPRPGAAGATASAGGLLLDHSGIVVWEADAATLAVFHLGRHTAARAGAAPIEAGLVTDLVHPEDRERVVQVCRAVATDHARRMLDHRLPSCDGTDVRVRHVIALSSDEATPVHRLRGVMIDVTDLVRAGEERRRLTAATIARDITDEQHARAKTASLLEIARHLTGSLDMPTILAHVHRDTAALVPCDVVATFYWRPEHNAFRFLAQHGFPPELARAAEAIEFRPGHRLVEHLAQGRTLVVNEMDTPSPVAAWILEHFGVQALVAAPLAVRGRVLGALVALRRRSAAPFDAAQVDLVENIARQVALAAEGVDLYRAQQEEMQVAAALAHVGRAMISSVNAPVLLDRLCQLSNEIFDADLSQTVLWRPEEDAYVPVSAYGHSAEQLEVVRLLRFSRPQVDDLLRRLAMRGVHHGTVADLAHLSMRRLMEAAGMESFLVMALQRGTEIIGIHSVCRRAGRVFTVPQQRIAEGIVQIASMALENARLVEELERANRLKSDFVATVSHELRTPLNAIVGYNDLILDGAFGVVAPELAEPLRRLGASARQLVELINTTLDMSRIDTGRLPLDVQQVNVRRLVQEIDSEMGEVGKAGVEFRWDLAARLPRLRTDPLKLKLVLKNLIANALKFTDEGAVVVSARRAGAHVEFAVQDTGIGISPGARELIFEPFRQANTSLTRRHGGVGLGLYIVRRLVGLLGGGVHLESEVGKGSTFRVSLPLDG